MATLISIWTFGSENRSEYAVRGWSSFLDFSYWRSGRWTEAQAFGLCQVQNAASHILQWSRGAPDHRQCFEGHIATGNHRCARDGVSLLVLVVDETIISRFEVQRFPSCSGSAIAPSLYSMRKSLLIVMHSDPRPGCRCLTFLDSSQKASVDAVADASYFSIMSQDDSVCPRPLRWVVYVCMGR
jgi:hypothetical protein